MKIAVVGSRGLEISENTLNECLPKETKMIISGCAKGIDSCAASYAKKNNIELLEILPEYKKYGKAAPIVRNKLIVEMSDAVLIFWDNKSKGTKNVIDFCQKCSKPLYLHTL